MLDLIGASNDFRELLHSVNGIVSREPELSITRCFISRIPPERLAFVDAIDPSDFFYYGKSGITYDRQRFLEQKVGYAGSCRLCMSVQNHGLHVASIRSIVVNKTVLPTIEADWSMLFTPEGGLGGDPWRFYCNLDDNPQRMRLCHPERGQYVPCGDADYFECGGIRIEPDHTEDIVLVLVATDSAYGCTIQVRAESAKAGTYIIEPEEQPDLVVIPLGAIAEDRRYWYNFGTTPTGYSLEKNGYRVLF